MTSSSNAITSFLRNPQSVGALALQLIENAQRHFQGSLFGCFEYVGVPYTAHTIVCTIDVSIDCNWFDVSNPFTRKTILK